MELAGDITCVAAFGSRVFAGDASGSLRCYEIASNGDSSKETEQLGGARGAAGSAEALAAPPPLVLSTPAWVAHGATRGAILSICVVPDPRAQPTPARNAAAHAEKLLLVVGAASGELVFFCNETEARRLQLESAVLRVCAHGDELFLAGDLLGSLYGVNQYQVLWKERLGDAPQSSVNDSDGAFFYPPTAQPVFKAIASITVKDIEHTLSSYALISTGQRQLLVTHDGTVFAHIPVSAPVSAITCFSRAKGDGDVVLVAGEDGKVYRISTSREPSFRFIVELWVEVPFPVANVVHVNTVSSDAEAKGDAFAWLCVGVSGQIALFRGKKLVHEWHATPIDRSLSNSESCFPVASAVLTRSSNGNDATQEEPSVVLVVAFSDRVQLHQVEAKGIHSAGVTERLE